MLHEMEREQCNGCELRTGEPNNTALVSVVKVVGLNRVAREVRVKRCMVCDTAACGVCRERTMIVKQKRCKRCGHNLIPESGEKR